MLICTCWKHNCTYANTWGHVHAPESITIHCTLYLIAEIIRWPIYILWFNFPIHRRCTGTKIIPHSARKKSICVSFQCLEAAFVNVIFQSSADSCPALILLTTAKNFSISLPFLNVESGQEFYPYQRQVVCHNRTVDGWTSKKCAVYWDFVMIIKSFKTFQGVLQGCVEAPFWGKCRLQLAQTSEYPPQANRGRATREFTKGHLNRVQSRKQNREVTKTLHTKMQRDKCELWKSYISECVTKCHRTE